MDNLKTNKQILKAIDDLISTYPHLRFYQALTILHVLETTQDLDGDLYYEENEDIIKRLVENSPAYLKD